LDQAGLGTPYSEFTQARRHADRQTGTAEVTAVHIPRGCIHWSVAALVWRTKRNRQCNQLCARHIPGLPAVENAVESVYHRECQMNQRHLNSIFLMRLI